MKKACRKAPSLWGIPFVRLQITVAIFVNWHKENYCSVSGKTLKICRRSVVKIINVSEPTVRRKIKTVISCGFQISCHFMILAFVYSVITELKSARVLRSETYEVTLLVIKRWLWYKSLAFLLVNQSWESISNYFNSTLVTKWWIQFTDF